MVRQEVVVFRVCLWLVLFNTLGQSVNTDPAGLYDPIQPHRRIPPPWSIESLFPYYYDFDYRTADQVRSGQANSSPSQPKSRPASSAPAQNGQRNIPSRTSAPVNPYFYRYPYQYPSGPSGFHAANQLEFLGPIESTDYGHHPTYFKQPQHQHPRPSTTIMGLGGGGGAAASTATASAAASASASASASA